MYKTFSMELGGRTLSVDIGRVAAQANGAAFMHYGNTVVLSTATASEKPREGIVFFPLSVEYNEKMYSVGKIPGGFTRREGKPSDNAILTCRVIDRPMRPLFPKDYRNDVTLENLVMCMDHDFRAETGFRSRPYGGFHQGKGDHDRGRCQRGAGGSYDRSNL